MMIYALIVADIIMLATFFLNFNTLPPQIPLFYSQPWGEEQLADIWFIFLLPLFMHLFIFLNGYVYNRWFFPDSFVKKTLEVTNWTLIILCSIIFVRIILLVS